MLRVKSEKSWMHLILCCLCVTRSLQYVIFIHTTFSAHTISITQACTSMRDLMDGSWVSDPSTMLGFNESSPDQVGPTFGWNTVWEPHSCRLQLYTPAEVQQALDGKHILVIGDSTTHMLMAAVMWLILGPAFKYPQNVNDFCGHNNRVYDSGDMLFPLRFGFLWDGSAGYCDNNKGLGDVLDNDYGRERFRRGLGKDVDYVIMNSGAHDLAGIVPLEDYNQTLPKAFDMVLNASASVREHRERFVWRTTTSHVYNVGDWNAGGQWMNFLAERHAHRYGFAVLDSHKVWLSDNELRRANLKELIACGDGLHGRGDYNVGTDLAPQWRQEYCEKLFAEAALTVHHMMQVLAEPQATESSSEFR